MTTTAEKIAVMQAYLDGKPVELKLRGWVGENCKYKQFSPSSDTPRWDWATFDYRIAVTKPSINWDHVAKEFVCMMYSSGNWILTDVLPFTMTGGYPVWAPMSQPKYQLANAFSSFVPGTCAPEDSLVERPK